MTKDLTLGFNYEASRFEPFVILAVTLADQDLKTQGQRNAEFALWLIGNGIPFKQLIGCYRGAQEISFLIRNADFVAHFAEFDPWIKGQESIMLLSEQAHHRTGQRTATLVYSRAAGNYKEELGLWTNVTREEALKQDAWTFDPAFDEYYIAKGKRKLTDVIYPFVPFDNEARD